METVVDKQPDEGPGRQPGPARPGQSGEGARSALEHLMQQERKREAQLPREGSDGGGDARTPP